jgi:hypothetical protein
MRASINFVGDVSIFRKYEEMGIDPFHEVLLPDSDYNIGNMEFVIPNGRTKNFYDVPDEYAVTFPYFTSLSLGRFNAYGLANNHCMDYGLEGVLDMRDFLISKGISVFGFGEKDFNVLRFSCNGIEFGVIAFVKKGRWSRKDRRKGPDPYDTKAVLDKVISLKQACDHVIVYPHWGTELIDAPHEKEIKNARLFIDSGASAVIGHHPHIVQGTEKYAHGIIAYSLGSFIYIPEEELGFSKSQGAQRNFSFCLNLEFDKNSILSCTPQLYRYDLDSKLPLADASEQGLLYQDFVNSKIGDSKYYHSRLRKVLIKREIRSMAERFRKNPLKALRHYSTYFASIITRKLKY